MKLFFKGICIFKLGEVIIVRWKFIIPSIFASIVNSYERCLDKYFFTVSFKLGGDRGEIVF